MCPVVACGAPLFGQLWTYLDNLFGQVAGLVASVWFDLVLTGAQHPRELH